MPKINDIVLVHGGFVDGAGWRGVYDILKKDGFNVGVVQNPGKSKPSWYLQVRDDKMIPYPAQQFMAKRAGATVVEVPGSHAIYVSNPIRRPDRTSRERHQIAHADDCVGCPVRGPLQCETEMVQVSGNA